MTAGQARRSVFGAAALAAALMLGGCGDGDKVVLHEPGVYKGKTDPLVELQQTPEQRESLQSRLRHQMDR
jgi:hypothetical protein